MYILYFIFIRLIIERSSVDGGRTPPLVLCVQHYEFVCLVCFCAALRALLSLGGGCGGRGRGRGRGWKETPPRDEVIDQPWCRRVESCKVECVEILGVCDR